MLRSLLLLPFAALVLACSSDDGGAAGESPPAPSPTATSTPEAAEATATPSPAPAATPLPSPQPPTPEPTAIATEDLPIVDLHFHPEPAWGDLEALFDQLNVRAAGNGASGPSSIALEQAEQFPSRIIAFGGGHEVRQLILAHGEQAWDLQAGEITAFLDELDAQLQAGEFRGIGEIHVNNQASNIPGSPQYLYPADSPLLQELFSLAGAHGVPLSIHMDAEPASVAEMERLLSSNRSANLLWAHTGHYAEPDLIRRLLEQHPNLYCELSYRISLSVSRTATPMDTNGVLAQDWLELLEAFPDRFVIGTDLSFAAPASYAAMIAAWRGVLLQLSPATAAALAHLNAERLIPDLP